MYLNGLHSKLCNIGGEYAWGGVVNVNSHTDSRLQKIKTKLKTKQYKSEIILTALG